MLWSVTLKIVMSIRLDFFCMNPTWPDQGQILDTPLGHGPALPQPDECPTEALSSEAVYQLGVQPQKCQADVGREVSPNTTKHRKTESRGILRCVVVARCLCIRGMFAASD